MLQLNHFPSFVEFVSDSTLNDTLIHLFCRSSSKTCLKFKSMTPFVEQWQPDQNTDQAEMLFCSDQQGQIQSLSKENAHTHTLSLYSEPRFSFYPQLIKSGGCSEVSGTQFDVLSRIRGVRSGAVNPERGFNTVLSVARLSEISL